MESSRNYFILSAFIGNKFLRHEIEFGDLSTSVSTIKEKAAQILNLPEDEIELAHGGHLMQNDKQLNDYGVKAGSLVQYFKKIKRVETVLEPLDSEKLKNLKKQVLAILAHKSRRRVLEQMFKTKQTMKHLLAATPGLSRDVIAHDIMETLETFVLAATNEIDALQRIVNAHPAFGHAALNLVAMVNEEAAKAWPQQPRESVETASRDAYALDRISDDEDEEEAMELEGVNPNENLAPGASATGVITNDFFQRAMMMATGGAAPLQTPAAVTQAQLDQLRDMGISDEAVARRALEQAGGDINLALEMLFGDGL